MEKVVFNTNDKNGINRLFKSSLNITETYFDNVDNNLGHSKIVIGLGQFISPQHKQPILQTDRMVEIRYPKDFSKTDKIHYWQINIEIENLSFKDNESVNIFLREIS